MSDLIDAIDTATEAWKGQVAATTDAHMAATTQCEGWTVKDLLEHTAMSVSVFSRSLDAGAAEIDPTSAESFSTAADAVAAAIRARGADGTVKLFGNDMPAPLALGLYGCDLYLHALDLSRAIGSGLTLDDGASQVLWDATRVAMEGGRGQSFADAVVVPEDAPIATRFVAFSGRQP